MGFEPMISGMKILRPRRTEQRCCLFTKPFFFFCFLDCNQTLRCGNFEESNNTINKIEEKRGNRYHIRAYGTDQSPID